MMRAPSATRNMASRSGGCGISTGRAPYLRSKITRASCTEVRELVSTATVWISAAGREDTSRMLRTAPWQAIPAPGITCKSCRVNSYEGTMPISAAPLANWSAQAAGMRKSRSNSPCCGPCSIPHTNGVVLRKLTAQTRGLTGIFWLNSQCNKPTLPALPGLPMAHNQYPWTFARCGAFGILNRSAPRVRAPGQPMNPKHISALTLVLFGAASAFGQIGQVTLNTVPSRSIGSPSLNLTSLSPNLVEGRELYFPQSVALDTSTTPPAIYVSDSVNNRVLAWKDANGFKSGQKANLQIGQPDLATTFQSGPGTGFSHGLSRPTGIAVYKGDLYVADTGNNRILRCPKPFDQLSKQ